MTDTLRALDEAIQKHIATAFEGDLVDHWILVTHSQTLEGFDLSNYRIVTPETQAIHVDMGLVETGKLIVRDSWDNAGQDDD